jgi:hypothetical protein
MQRNSSDLKSSRSSASKQSGLVDARRCVFALRPDEKEKGGDGYEKLSDEVRDGAQLAGWSARPQPAERILCAKPGQYLHPAV